VIGIEWDEEAISVAREVLRPFGERVKIFRENFTRLAEILGALDMKFVDGLLLDLGLSSIQLENRERGFSLKGEGPLDMRMDQRLEVTAADLVNGLSQDELQEILFSYGEERWSRRIARSIVEERRRGPIQTTSDLRRIVLRAIPHRRDARRIDPATRTFQALRIRTNRELDNLKQVLNTGWAILRKGGRMCVISFHSLEDRMVKETFQRLSGARRGEGPNGAVLARVTRKPIVPSEAERMANPRSRSAKLRCAERV
jgi:16S rRNA (cytosine1402-N4)-methyltransferase